MRKVLDLLYQAGGWFAASCILVITLLVMGQVVLNLVDRLSTLLTGQAVGLTIPSYADFTGFFLAAASFMALAYSLREGSHIRVSLVTSRLPARLQRPMELWCLAVSAAVSLYFTWYTGKLVYESFLYNDLSPGMIAVPLWIPQAPMLCGLLLLSLAFLDELVVVWRRGKPSYSAKGESILSDEEPQSLSVAGKGGR
jgi:TRAP-type C4-dicarboxylate transport system permease small subunit